MKLNKNSSISMLFRNIKFMPIETVNRAKITWLCFKSVDYGTRLLGVNPTSTLTSWVTLVKSPKFSDAHSLI